MVGVRQDRTAGRHDSGAPDSGDDPGGIGRHDRRTRRRRHESRGEHQCRDDEDEPAADTVGCRARHERHRREREVVFRDDPVQRGPRRVEILAHVGKGDRRSRNRHPDEDHSHEDDRQRECRVGSHHGRRVRTPRLGDIQWWRRCHAYRPLIHVMCGPPLHKFKYASNQGGSCPRRCEWAVRWRCVGRHRSGRGGCTRKRAAVLRARRPQPAPRITASRSRAWTVGERAVPVGVRDVVPVPVVLAGRTQAARVTTPGPGSHGRSRETCGSPMRLGRLLGLAWPSCGAKVSGVDGRVGPVGHGLGGGGVAYACVEMRRRFGGSGRIGRLGCARGRRAQRNSQLTLSTCFLGVGHSTMRMHDTIALLHRPHPQKGNLT